MSVFRVRRSGAVVCLAALLIAALVPGALLVLAALVPVFWTLAIVLSVAPTPPASSSFTPVRSSVALSNGLRAPPPSR